MEKEYQSDDEPLFSKNDIIEIRKAMVAYIDENEELHARIIAMDAMMKNKDAVLKRANIYIKQLEASLISCKGEHYQNLN